MIFSSVVRIVKAIQCALQEKSRSTRQFKQKQKELYMEGLTETKVNQQLQYYVTEMQNDPEINYIRIRFAREASPFIMSALSRVTSEVIECAEENEYVIMRDTELL